MKLDKKMVDYIANLSRIKLNEQQSSLMLSELEKILQYMDILSTVNTEGIEPLSHVFDMANILRSDAVGIHYDRNLLLLNAHDCTEETFAVPRTVEG